MEELARRIIMLRKELGLSSEKLAQRIGTSHKAVITWEKNRGDPSLDNLIALADLFGVTPDYLIGRTEERTRSGEGDAAGLVGERSEASDEAALEGDARRASPRPTPRRQRSTRRPES